MVQRRRPAILSLLLLPSLVIVCAARQEAGSPALAPPPHAPLVELIRRLGSEDFREREDATAQLGLLPFNAPPPKLLEATRSTNPEIRRRAIEAAAAIRMRAERRAIGRERVFAKDGAVDLFVASTTRWNLPPQDERIWQTVLDVATALDDRTKFRWRIAGKRRVIKPSDFWLVSLDMLFVRSEETYQLPDKNLDGTAIHSKPGGILALEVVAPHALDRNLVIARGPVRVRTRAVESVILANGDVTTGYGLEVAVIVCDGNVEVAAGVNKSVVIARGDITVGELVSDSTLIAAGKVTLKKPQPPADHDQPVVEERVRVPLNFVKFFELPHVGVDVKVTDKAVVVAKVADNKAFAAAGVEIGDVITAVNGKKPDDAESLRRMLRDALALGDAAVVVRRGDRTETLKVSLPE